MKSCVYIQSLFLAILFCSGCSMFSYQNTKNLDSVPRMRGSVCEAIRTNLVTVGDWPEEEWWLVFDSGELSDLISIALEESPTIKKAEQKIEVARQNALQKRSKLFPWLFIDLSDEWLYLSKNGLYHELNPNLPLHANLLNFALGMNYEVDIWSKYRNLYKAAVGELFVEQAEAKQVEIMVSTAVAQAYFSLKVGLAKERLLKRLYETQCKLVSLEVLLGRSGLASEFPIYSEKELLEEARQALLAISEEIVISRYTLNTLIGRGADEILCLSDCLPPLPKNLAVPETVSIDLIARRPDLMAAIWRVASIGHLVGAQVAEFFPNINLGGFLGLQSFRLENFFDWASKTAGLLPALHLPVFTAGNIKAGVDKQKAAYEEAVFAYNEQILQAVKEITSHLKSLTTVYEKRLSQENLLEYANARLSLKRLNFVKGLENQLSVCREEIDVIMKSLKAIDFLYGQYFFSVELIKSLGGGYTAETPVPIKAKCQEQDPCCEVCE